MNNLINVTLNENQEPVVSGRQLHQALGVKTRYNDWFNRMIDYGFAENEDYLAITQKRVTAQNNETTFNDHVLKLDMAKEIAMIQRTDKGKEVRQYFIQVEKDFNSPEKIMARALKIADRKIIKLEATIEEQKPKVIFANAVSASHTSILVGDFAKLMRQNGLNFGQNRMFAWLRENGYLISRKGNSWNMPTQKAMDLGLFEIKETTINHSDGHISINKTPKITGKGQLYFADKLLNNIA
ncbi:phage antirepressor KilAC domain-containing protein [Streptococcus lutetiensis]|uniref:phage antirepressor KilAC domain-containing protein n=1 Tax=Streptococcus lutetiensis TaxID=150055 RepID=UPI001BD98D20|nr:phage antirepressor KilAC domain-containing protein [Streptococcus lutetiensis]MBT0932901.1 phage antirepressor KilAC domain-containing protein [Streptococcus lutetiensis]MBT0941681.1 phage antirepressor KilAC domain-containing protein [Streptococcus lutetiensis]MDU2563791.1 phage antirepressor KilAC domain-containing protein [Streptococcus lutetiensis]